MYQDYAFLGIAPWHRNGGEYYDEDINIIKYMKILHNQAQKEQQQKTNVTTNKNTNTKQPIIKDHNGNVVQPDPDGF